MEIKQRDALDTLSASPQHPHPGVTSYANCGKIPMEFVGMLEISSSKQIRKKI